MDKYKNKYRISSARLLNWDYTNNGAYFITICTKNRKHFYGEIVANEMILNEIGITVQKFWLSIPIHFPFVELGNFVVMPNHMHGILVIENRPVESLNPKVYDRRNSVIPKQKNEQMSRISPKPGSISTIIRSYKSVVTTNAHLIDINFDWQSLFHDHIIRNSKSFETIQNYIADNPKNCGNDEFYS